MAIVNKGWAFVSGSGDYNAGGSNTEIQFNNAGNLDGTADLTWDGSKVHTTNLSASSNISASAFYGDGSNLTNVTASAVSVADGPEMSLQFRYDSPIGKEISGSADLMWITSSTPPFLQVTGNLKTEGYLYVGKNGTAYIINNKDEDTKIRLGGPVPPGTNGMTFTCGGKDLLVLDNNGVDRVILGTASSDLVYSSGSFTASQGIRMIGNSVVEGTLDMCPSAVLNVSNINACSPLTISASSIIFTGSTEWSGTISGSEAIFTTLSASNIVGASPLTISASTITISGPLSSSQNISASAFYGSALHVTSATNQRLIELGDSTCFLSRPAPDEGLHSLRMASTNGEIMLSASEGVVVVAGTVANENAFFLDSGTEFAMLDGADSVVLTILNSGDLSASNSVSASEYYIQAGNSIYFGSGNNTKITRNGNNLDFNATNIIFNAGTQVSASSNLSASAFYGDGANLTNLPGGGGGGGGIFTELSPKTAATTSSVSIGTIGAPQATLYVSSSQDEELLIVDTLSKSLPILFATGSGRVGINTDSPTYALTVSGNISASVNISASAFYGDGSNLSGLSSDTVDTTTDTSDATFYVPFVNQSTGQSGETLYIHDVLALNPSSSAVKISESGTKTAALIVSSSIGDANALGGKDLGKVTFPGAPGSSDDALQIRGGYANMGGNKDFLTIAAAGTDAVLFVTASNKMQIEATTLSFKGAANFNSYVSASTAISASEYYIQDGNSIYFGAGDATKITRNSNNLDINSTNIILNAAALVSASAELWAPALVAESLSASTGQVSALGNLSASINISASAFYGSEAYISSSGDEALFRIDSLSPSPPIVFVSGAAGVGINTDSPNVSFDVRHTGTLNPVNLENDTGGGEVVYFGSASGPLVTGGLYYLNTDGGWQSANAATTGSGHNQLVGIAMGNKPLSKGILIKGYFDVSTFYSGSFIKGAPMYIQSSSVARTHLEGGFLSGAAPSAGDSYVRVLGYGTDTANVIYFNPDATYVELA